MVTENEVFSIGNSAMRQREGGIIPGPETSTKHHCSIREPQLHLFPLAMEEKDTTALLQDSHTQASLIEGS